MDRLISDDFFRLAHNDISGKPLLHPVALSTGVAAGLLADLVWFGYVHIGDGDVWLVSRPGVPLPSDRVLAKVVQMLWHERHPLSTWLEFLATGAVGEVAARLGAAGQLRRERSRRGLRSTVTYKPTDLLEAARPRAVLATRLMAGQPIEPWYVVLGGLMAATGLDVDALAGSPDGRAYLRWLVAGASAPMRELFAHTEAAIGAAVLAHRT